jgi:flagellar hook assembly protein FlgD
LYPYYDVVLDQGAIENIIPPTFSLNQNYPNPFNPSTTISYQIPQTGSIRIDIFNIKGQKIRTLINELKHPGKHSVVWNGTDQSGRQVASGIYYYRIVTDHNSSTKKMLLLK